ncbi:MAG: RNA polymerase sigma-54 factor [Gammaproteobacteria bacterium]|jgi:RNA polymerase sigma-54 factor
MKQSFELRLGQSLTMTPALQQAIKLLQLSSLELESEIQDALESNIMLEDASEEFSSLEKSDENSVKSSDGENDNAVEQSSTLDSLPDTMQEDYRWDDIYDVPSQKNAGGIDEDGLPFVERVGDESDNDLQGHLLWQLELSLLSTRDRQLTATVVDALDFDGYLRLPLETIFTSCLTEHRDQEEPSSDEMSLALKQVQQLDPPGVGARDLRECLLIQLHEQYPDLADNSVVLAKQVIDQHLELLGTADLAKLRRVLNVEMSALSEAIAVIRGLNPKPGAKFQHDSTEYISPDVYVKRHGLMWIAELTPGATTPLRVNELYATLAKKTKGKDAETMKNHLQEAKWFIKSLQSRNETLLKVANSIVMRQHKFFELGAESLVPLVLRDIAEDVEMHESTISRITSSKYMHTPFGVLRFKHFFSSHVGTRDGGEAAATAIQAMLKKLVAAERPNKPLSDTALVKLLAEKDIEIARRTVAKYREALSIPPSHARKRLA